MRLPFWCVEPEWKGETVAILGGGPSLTQDQLVACRGRCRVIAINNAYWLAPWADILYFCDEVWWIWHHGGVELRQKGAIATPVRHAGYQQYREFEGIKAALANARTHVNEPAVRVLQNYGDCPGLCPLPDGVYTGRNSGYQAVQLAVHLGAARLLLLGFDMRAVGGRTHWHSGTPLAHHRATDPHDLEKVMLPHFATIAESLRTRGIEVLNCTPGSAITCFPTASLEDALCRAGA